MRDNNCQSRIVHTTKSPFIKRENKDISRLKTRLLELKELLDCTSDAKVSDGPTMNEEVNGLVKEETIDCHEFQWPCTNSTLSYSFLTSFY